MRGRKRSYQASSKEPRNGNKSSPGEEPELTGEEFFEVEKIVGAKVGKNGVKLYKTRWKGYGPDDDTWEPLKNIAHTGEVERYERKQMALTLSTISKESKSTTSAAVTAVAEDKPKAGGKEFFKVAKILGTKIGKNGVKLYKTRWEGYGPDDDTWEPLKNIAHTGEVDRYERKQRALTLSTYTPGVAVIEYDDGERQTIDLLREKFRSFMVDDNRDENDHDVNDFKQVCNGAKMELLWPHANLYFACKVISWTPLLEDLDPNNSGVVRHGSLIWTVKNENSSAKAAPLQQEDQRTTSAASNQVVKQESMNVDKNISDKRSRKKSTPNEKTIPKTSTTESIIMTNKKRGRPCKKDSSEKGATKKIKSMTNKKRGRPCKKDSSEGGATKKIKGGDAPSNESARSTKESTKRENSVVTSKVRCPVSEEDEKSVPSLEELQDYAVAAIVSLRSHRLPPRTEPVQCPDDDVKISSSNKIVGRGAPLYSGDEYSSEDEEGGDMGVCDQPSYQNRDGPKLSFEELWKAKLQLTQSIMDMSKGEG